MEHVTLTIEGTASEVQIALRRLGTTVVGPGEQEVGSISWLDGEIANFFNELQDNAKRILTEIANQPDGYNRDELLAALGFGSRELAGSLSSVGHTLRRFYPLKPKPVVLDDETWKYVMLPEVARWLTTNTASRAGGVSA